MRISGPVYLNSKGEIQLHRNTIEGLTIFDGSILYGVYYPRSKDEPETINKGDFMLSPIPFQYWPLTARMIIRLKKQSKGIPKITKLLKDNQITIHHSVSNRSAHRYSTWDIHFSFDKLLNSKLVFDENKSYYLETFDELENLKKLVKDEINDDILFSDDKDIDLNTPIFYRINTALHYFYKMAILRDIEAGSEDNGTIFKSFSLRYLAGNLITNSGRKISNILSLSNDEPSSRLIPTIGFIEAESHYLNYRLRIIPREKLENFYKITIFYESHAFGQSSSRGLLNLIIESLTDTTKLWTSYTQLYEFRNGYECGRLNFIIETEEKHSNRTVFIENVKSLINDLEKNNTEPDLNKVKFWPKISPIYPNYIRKHFKKQREILFNRKKDVFISYSLLDEEDARYISNFFDKHNITYWMAGKDLTGGDIWNEEIRKHFNDCREVCLLYSPNSMNSQYVTTEWGAAWFMNKKIVIVRSDIDSNTATKVDTRIANSQMIRIREKDLEEYCERILQRRLEYYLETDNYEYYN